VTTEVSKEALAEAIMAPMQAALERKGITVDRLAEELNEQLEAQETKVVKISGAPNALFLPAGVQTLVQGDQETVMGVAVVAWGVRQQAMIQGLKLLAQYPAEVKRVVHDGAVTQEVSVDRETREIFDRVAEAFTSGRGK
jgi:hypothetical protein